jgi:hypothetical protein
MMTITDISTVGRIETYDIETSASFKSDIESLCEDVQLTLWLVEPTTYLDEIINIRQKSQQIVMKYLPEALLREFEQFNLRPVPQMLIIKQLPFEGPQESELTECFLLGISGVMKPFTYKNEHNRRLLHHVQPDSMALYCLIGDPAAMTTLYSLAKLYSNVDKNLRDQLESVSRSNEFIFKNPQSFTDGKVDEGALIFDLANGEKTIRFDKPLHLYGRTDEAQRLTEQLLHFFNTKEGRPDGYSLQRGDMLIWSNHTNIHGRTAYAPDYMPSDKRFVIRMLMASNHALPLSRD